MDYFNKLKGSVKSLKNDLVIDNLVFGLHCRFTILLLLLCAILVGAQLGSEPIRCSVDKGFDESYESVLNTFCWIQSTFTIPNLLSEDNVEWAKAHPGVRPQAGPEDSVLYHKYYQWVILILVLQAALFCVSSYIWKSIEGGRVEMYVMDLNQRNVSKETIEQEKALMVEGFLKNRKEKDNQCYLIWFAVCELLNFVNVVAQIFLMDAFLGNEFTRYGTEVLKFVEMEHGPRTDPMDKIFPKVSKCTFNKYGPSGNIINFDGICILPLNIVNEKIYVFLWFWFLILAIVTGVALIYRLAIIFISPVRLQMLRRSVIQMSSIGKTNSEEFQSQQRNLEMINRKFKPDDWFLLYQLGKNINAIIFRDIISKMGAKLKEEDRYRSRADSTGLLER